MITIYYYRIQICNIMLWDSVRRLSSMFWSPGGGAAVAGWSALTVLGLHAKGFQLKVAAGEQRRASAGNSAIATTTAKTILCIHRLHRLCFCMRVFVLCIRQIINRRGRSCSNYTSAPFIPPPSACVPVVCADGWWR